MSRSVGRAPAVMCRSDAFLLEHLDEQVGEQAGLELAVLLERAARDAGLTGDDLRRRSGGRSRLLRHARRDGARHAARRREPARPVRARRGAGATGGTALPERRTTAAGAGVYGAAGDGTCAGAWVSAGSVTPMCGSDTFRLPVGVERTHHDVSPSRLYVDGGAPSGRGCLLRSIGSRTSSLEPYGVELGASDLDDDAQDLLERCDARQDLGHAVVAQRQHSLLACDLTDGHARMPARRPSARSPQ